jgi:drug/metabolite transporter (DMT)-like permease
VSGHGVAALLVGVAGAALLLLAGKQTGGASLIGLVAGVGAAAVRAGGSVASPRLALPRGPVRLERLADPAGRSGLHAAR